MAFLDNAGLKRLCEHIERKLSNKIDKVAGKCLSTNDYTNEEKEKLASTVAETAKINAELNKRPIAYPSFEASEYTWEYSGNIADYENIDLAPIVGVDTEGSTLVAVKVLEVAPVKTELDSIYYSAYVFSDIGELTETTGAWQSYDGVDDIYVMGVSNIPLLIAVYNPVTVDGLTINPGFWALHMSDQAAVIGVHSVYFPNVTVPGVKMSSDLIDAEWMAKRGSLEVEINSENVSEYLTDEISDFASMSGMNAVLKISDHFVSPSEFKNATCSFVDFGTAVSGSDVLLVLEPGTLSDDVTIIISDMWCYQLDDYVILLAGENAVSDIADGFLVHNIPKGVYFGAASEESLLALGTLKFYCPEVADIVVPLPDKYLSDMVVQAGTKTGYFPLEIDWDGEIGDRENTYEARNDVESAGYVKVSDLIPSKEELIQGTVDLYIKFSNKSASMSLDLKSAVITEQEGGIIFNVTPEDLASQMPIVVVTDFNKFVLNDINIPNGLFPSNGLYFLKCESYNGSYAVYTSKLTFPHYQTITKKIDPELVDMDWYAGKQSGALDVSFNGDDTGYEKIVLNETLPMVKLSDATPTIDELREGFIGMPGSDDFLITDLIGDGSFSLITEELYGMQCPVLMVLGQIPLIGVLPEDTYVNGVFVSKGTYTANLSGDMTIYTSHLYIPYVAKLNEDVKIPEKYLPDTINIPDMSQYATKEELESVAENIVEEADLNAMLQEVLQ